MAANANFLCHKYSEIKYPWVYHNCFGKLHDIVFFITQKMLMWYFNLMDPKVALHKHINYDPVQIYY